jgi:hypothetical protein
VLAHGKTIGGINHVRLLHPEVGDCHELERAAAFSTEARAGWQACFEALSTWTAGWAGKSRGVNLRSEDCVERHISVTVARYGADGWFWWVPHPHIGGKPYTYYTTAMMWDADACRGATSGSVNRQSPASLTHAMALRLCAVCRAAPGRGA